MGQSPGDSAVARDVAVNSGGRVPELDGLRGLAILLVILCHYIGNSDGGSVPALSLLARLFGLGWSGVDLFFVLSGFLIGGLLFDAKEAPRYFQTFYARRFFRILPIYYLWVTLFALAVSIAPRWNSGAGAAEVTSPMPVPFYYFFLQNLVFVPYAGLAWYWISVTWSLAVEEQFYLVAPPLIRFLPVRRLTGVLAGCVVAAPALRLLLTTLWKDGYAAAYILMPCRADALAIGMLLAVAWRNARLRMWLGRHVPGLWGALLVLFAGVLALLKWFPEPYHRITQSVGYTWLALFYACLMLVALLDSGSLVARCARWKWLRELGTVSYCVYLIHFLVLAACHWLLLGSRPRIYGFPGAATTLLAAVLTYGIAKLSWVYFEKVLIRRGHSFSYWAAASALEHRAV